MSFTTLEERGDAWQPSRPYLVYLYPNSQSVNSSINDEILYGGDLSDNEGIYGLCESMYSDGVIDFYRIQRYNDTLNISDNTLDNFSTAFKNWLEVSDYIDWRGTHLAVSSNNIGGRAQSPSNLSHTTGFVDAKRGVMGVYSNENGTAQVAVHEVLHTIINRGIDEIEDMVENDTDHDLGHLYMIGHEEGASSPLLGTYGSEHWSTGDCNSDIASTEEAWTKMNSCEHTGVEVTADHEYDD
ncbi:hypothetical protein [Natronobeatus ordinarius]|uniref:hypothetical protein n=1 Tax=Natronobeatus ordinarius TaxID=2963433 RepID=UPI0020CBCF89|nr:hypothetical protein [Natronobeatus ordinarius]